MTKDRDLPDQLDHVLRPVPPWRETSSTECGLAIGTFPTITRDEFIAKVKKQGKQRSAMTTCMTCWGTAARNQDWAGNPAQVIQRDVNAWGEEKLKQINQELRALAALVQAHPGEFHGYLEGLEHTSSLDAARRRRRRQT